MKILAVALRKAREAHVRALDDVRSRESKARNDIIRAGEEEVKVVLVIAFCVVSVVLSQSTFWMGSARSTLCFSLHLDIRLEV